MAAHLTPAERDLLYRLKKQGRSNAEVARVMERHPSTIGRELNRNEGGRGYRPKQAQRMADRRRLSSRRPAKLEDGPTREYVVSRLRRRWSPDQIAGRMRHDFPRQPRRWLSPQTIYNWINSEAPEWKAWLRRGGRPPEKRGRLAGCVRIDGRPDVINRRGRYGDWEGDTVVGEGRRSALVTLVERKSGYMRVGRADDMRATTTAEVTRRRMKDLPASLRRSVTFDNGKEFAEHRRITEALGLEVYFAAPYRSWQRGANENANGLIRQFFPKGTDFSEVSHQAVARVERLVNERPRKRLDYRTPIELLRHRLRCN